MNSAPPIEKLTRINFLRIFNLLSNLEAQYNLTNETNIPIHFVSIQILLSELNSLHNEVQHSYTSELNYLERMGVGRLSEYTVEKEFTGITVVEKPKGFILFTLDIKKFQELLTKAKELYNSKQKANAVSEIGAEITFNNANEIWINIAGKKREKLARPDVNSENGEVFEYLYNHPNNKHSKTEIEQAINMNINKSLHKIVENLGFTGDIRKAFFAVGKDSICFRNPLTIKQLAELEITDLQAIQK